MKILVGLFKRRSVILSVVTFSIVSMFFLYNLTFMLPRIPSTIGYIESSLPTRIFDTEGNLIYTLGGYKMVKLEDISESFIHAIIATEDHRFWKHHGVSKIRILKAIFVTFLIPEKIQGASTITQQLAKNLFFSFERTYLRKLREFLVALQIETQFSKEEILQAYVNQISFGAGIRGIEQASRFFFDKASSELNLSEASLLSGIPKSPLQYNPHNYPSRAKKRQMVVLKRMLRTGIIDYDQLQMVYNTPLSYKDPNYDKNNNYFIDTVVKYVERNYGTEMIYYSGLKIFTTMDTEFQKSAEAVLKDGLQKIESQIDLKKNRILIDNSSSKLQGAIISIDIKTAGIKAMVGGRDFYETPFNRAIQNNRQSGSGFKPFLYYAAFANGVSPKDIIEDKKISMHLPEGGIWEPRNFGRSYQGPVVVKKAFIDSINTVAAQLVERVGPNAVIDVAFKCGIKSKLDPVYSVALGTSGVSPLEMASAFSTFAAGGIYREPYIIDRIEDSNGQVLEEHIDSFINVLNPTICYQVIDMMRGVVNIGPAKLIRYMGLTMDIAGKTGTTNGFIDAWFTGFTPSLSTSVWIGFDKNKGMWYKGGMGVTGGIGAVPIWSNFMNSVVKNNSSDSFEIPENIRFESVDPTTGEKSRFLTKRSMKVALIDNFGSTGN